MSIPAGKLKAIDQQLYAITSAALKGADPRGPAGSSHDACEIDALFDTAKADDGKIDGFERIRIAAEAYYRRTPEAEARYQTLAARHHLPTAAELGRINDFRRSLAEARFGTTRQISPPAPTPTPITREALDAAVACLLGPTGKMTQACRIILANEWAMQPEYGPSTSAVATPEAQARYAELEAQYRLPKGIKLHWL